MPALKRSRSVVIAKRDMISVHMLMTVSFPLSPESEPNTYMVLLRRHFKDASRWLGFKSLRTALPLTIYGAVRGAGPGLKSANLADMLSVF